MKTEPAPFEPAFVQALTRIFEEDIVFNRTLGLKLVSVTPQGVTGSLPMRHALVGHPSYKRLHGGVISAALDALGGMAVLAAIGTRHRDEPVEARLRRFDKLGTIDLRVDYLRPAIGEHFSMQAEVMRLGSRVASTRMEFMAADGTLLCTGSAAYIVS